MNAEMTRASERTPTPMTYCVVSGRFQPPADFCWTVGGLPLFLGGAEAVAMMIPAVTRTTESCRIER